MGKAGQRTLTGIRAQTDVTLLYLLQASKRPDFREILIEGDRWEDFTLVFTDHNEDFEVRWWRTTISHGHVRSIVRKELGKNLQKNDVLRIVTKKISPELKQDLEYLRHYGSWLDFLGCEFFHRDNIVRKLHERGWKEDEIRFLLKTEVDELVSDLFVRDRIAEYFALEDPFYLTPYDQRSLVGQCFMSILEEGSRGGRITHRDFLDGLEEFRFQIASRSQSFSPEIPIRGKVANLVPFLKSAQEFSRLNDPKYLSPISNTPRLIFYISDKLEKNDFRVRAFDFFIKKILMRRSYVGLAMRLLQRKWESKKAEPRYLLRFLKTNYRRLFHQLNQYDALRIVLDIAKKHTSGEHDAAILSLTKSQVLAPPLARKGSTFMRPTKRRPDHDLLAGLVDILYWRSPDKRGFLDFVFEYFDLTGDDHHLLIATHPKIYGVVNDYIVRDFEVHFDYVVNAICSQFDLLYGGHYDGCEHTASGRSQAGSSHSITDKAMVRLLFSPVLESMYAEEPDKAWSLFKRKVLKKAPKQPNRNNPAFLKRALIPVLLGRMQDTKLAKADKRECLQFLKNILAIKKGVPETSEILFDQLRKQDLRRIGFANVLALVRMDSVKYRREGHPAGYPTNLFVVATLVALIEGGSQIARRYLLALVAKPDFIRRDEEYHSFDLLSSAAIPESDPDFIFQLLLKLDVPAYLTSGRPSRVWDVTRVLVRLITKDWSERRTRGKQLLESLLAEGTPNSQVLECVGGVVSDLAKIDPVQTLRLVHRQIADKRRFRQKASANPYVRQCVCRLGVELARTGHYDEAKTIVDLCIDDPDPETHNRPEDFNYHLQVKQGEGQIVITTVRGVVPWVLREFAVSDRPELVKYALDKTEMLLDLDGRLAEALGYTEPDYYVRLQGLLPLALLAHPAKRELLDDLELGLGGHVRQLCQRTITVVQNDIVKHAIKPKAISARLVDVFSNLRDLDTQEAKSLLRFFEKEGEKDAYFLFLYYAMYRAEQYPHIPFDPSYFKKKLRQLCRSSNVFRPKIAHEVWDIAREGSPRNRQLFERREPYWTLLFNLYDKEVFYCLYRTVEITLTWPERYSSHKKLLKRAINTETDHLRKAMEPVQAWELGPEVFRILRDHDIADFLDVLHFLVGRLADNTSYYGMTECIHIYQSIHPVPRNLRELYDKVGDRLRDLYPEEFQS